MKTIYETNWTRLQRILPGIETRPVAWATEIRSEPYMSLHVDVLDQRKVNGRVQVEIAIAHRYTQNGDSMADPDMKLRLYPESGMVEALTFQQDGFPGIGTLYQEVYVDNGTRYRPKLKKQLNSFLGTWLCNLHRQGHKLNPQAN